MLKYTNRQMGIDRADNRFNFKQKYETIFTRIKKWSPMASST